jgi:hypothetical protein
MRAKLPRVSELILVGCGPLSRRQQSRLNESLPRTYFPPLGGYAIDEIRHDAYSSLNSDDLEKVLHVLICIVMLYQVTPLLPAPSVAEVEGLLFWADSDVDERISAHATHDLLVIFVTFPEIRPRLLEHEIELRALRHLANVAVLRTLSDVVSCSQAARDSLERHDLVPELLDSLCSASGDVFVAVMDLFTELVNGHRPTAVAEVRAVVEAFSEVAWSPRYCQRSALKFLITAAEFCADLIVANGTARTVIRACLEFEDIERSLALRLLARLGEAGLIQPLLDGLAALIHHVFAIADEFAEPNGRVSALNLLCRVADADPRLVAGPFPEIADFFGVGSYDEKIAAAELVVGLMHRAGDIVVATYLHEIDAMASLAEMLACDFAASFQPILQGFIIIRELERMGEIVRALAEDFTAVIASDEFGQSLEGIVEGARADDGLQAVAELARALLGSEPAQNCI